MGNVMDLLPLGKFFLIIGILNLQSTQYYASRNVTFSPDTLNCSLSKDLIDEIAGYSWLVQNVTNLVSDGPLKGITFNKLASFVDTFGSRFTGTENLENAIDYLENFLNQSGLENVHTENVSVPVWTRNKETLHMILPRFKKLALLGLGSSIGTPKEGIMAEVIVVRSFDELVEKYIQVSGKIVVYNQPYYSYGQSVQYRSHGASMASKYGAVAALVRSVTPKSIYSPHTGWQYYDGKSTKIPVACITVEDAEMFQRMQDRGEKVFVNLTMEAQNLPDGISRNTVAERIGSRNPDEVVIVSGHIDTWDVGQGAMDDGGGAFVSLMVPYVLKDLGFRARRTLRAVLWTGEEPGLYGAQAYSTVHSDELANFNAVLESDEGTFNPKGLSFSGSDEAACIVQEILKLTASLNASKLQRPDDGSDTTVFSELGVPTASLLVRGDDYFDYHHSDGDTMTVENPDELDRCLTFWTVTSYVLADLSIPLPRQNISANSVHA